MGGREFPTLSVISSVGVGRPAGHRKGPPACNLENFSLGSEVRLAHLRNGTVKYTDGKHFAHLDRSWVFYSIPPFPSSLWKPKGPD